jgi:predicted phage tail protein
MTKQRNWADWLLITVAVITILTGLLQIIIPETILNSMGISPSSETTYFFRVLSLLIVLFGGALLQSALSGESMSVILLWASLQKLLGAAAVVLAVFSGLLTSGALAAAGYDFIAGLFLLWYRQNRRIS